ncbi:MAG: putative toxin-antitoxin system toxin component, PIN family [Herpetosiphonaceae bacterium]|nr:putative toxin-antitoxin system toxin component, PIN family [Herpetosiphonaceae bacterium]
MVRVVLDPGVLIAAVITPDGVCGHVLQAVIDQRCTTIVCPVLLDELEDVLLRSKFRRYLPIEHVPQYVALIGRIGETHPDPVTSPGRTPDPDDDYLVALAEAAAMDYLISGDPHLTDL